MRKETDYRYYRQIRGGIYQPPVYSYSRLHLSDVRHLDSIGLDGVGSFGRWKTTASASESRRRSLASMDHRERRGFVHNRSRCQSCKSLEIAGPMTKPENVTSNPSRCGEQHIMPTSTDFETGK